MSARPPTMDESALTALPEANHITLLFKGAGLVDGSWIAVRVRESGKASDTDGKDDMEVDEDPGWHVIVASYDDEEE